MYVIDEHPLQVFIDECRYHPFGESILGREYAFRILVRRAECLLKYFFMFLYLFSDVFVIDKGHQRVMKAECDHVEARVTAGSFKIRSGAVIVFPAIEAHTCFFNGVKVFDK